MVFHARVAAERADGTGYTIDDVADGIIQKLTRRHPHVFGDVDGVRGGGGQGQLGRDQGGRAAGGQRGGGSALDGMPLGQPALSLAAALQRRAERAGAPAELADLTSPVSADGDETSGSDETSGAAVSEIGAELFALAARARAAGLDPELELRSAARAYRNRVQAWERSARS